MTTETPPPLDLGENARSWDLPKGAPGRFAPTELHLGQGSSPLEIAVALSDGKPSAGEVRTLWERRHGKRASPLLCVAIYRHNGTWRAAVCGPAGDDPRALLDLDIGQTARVCSSALAEPNRHAATRFLLETLPEDNADIPGLRNAGMFATHYLRTGLPERDDWEKACEKGGALLDRSDRSLVEALGFAIERRDTTTSLLRVDGTARGVAIFLQDSDSVEGSGQRYGGISPASHALAAADREGLPYAILTRGKQIRIYAAGSDVGVGRKGRAETFVEVNLAVIPDGAAGYLPLLFGAEALRAGGSFEEILERSRDFATGLGERLRDRVYEQAVPVLAAAVVSRQKPGEEPDLDLLYEQTLLILFRLLFIAYAEDKDLLPYRTSGEYVPHALKTTARDLADRRNEGPLSFDPKATDRWAAVLQLFRAVELGNKEWQVPRYGGSLFSSDAEISRAGAAIADLQLSNSEVGPALLALLTDRAEAGTHGPVDFRSLSVREFGTIYEGLLESSLAIAPQDLTVSRDGTYVPAKDDEEIAVQKGEIYLHNRSGARKASGSYFTKPFAVGHLLDNALEPALDAHIERLTELMEKGEEAAAGEAFFDFRCADIAMGSGHFLVAAVDRIEARLSSFLAERPVSAVMAELERLGKAAEANLGELAPSVELEHSSLLRRQVARRCIYGVDRALVAVELARLALWIHTFVPGLPLGFLDRTLVHGDSLSGIGTLDEAASVLDPAGANGENTPSLYRERIEELINQTTGALTRLARASDADAAEVRAARKAFEEAQKAAEPARQLLDLLVAIRLGQADPIEEINEEVVASAAKSANATETAESMQALHFPLAFPEVFLRDRPGFNCLLGNPPWEKMMVKKDSFWALRFPGLNSMTVAKQNAAIRTYEEERPDIREEYERDAAIAERMRDLLGAGPFPGIGTGDIDLYKAFAWRYVHLLRNDGYVGVVLPRAIGTSAGMTEWRREVLHRLSFREALILRNRAGWVFPDLHHSDSVMLITLGPAQGDKAIPVANLRGPAPDAAEFVRLLDTPPAAVSVEELETWSDTSALPALQSDRSLRAFRQIRSHPSLSSDDHVWSFRPVSELHATQDKKYMVLDGEPGEKLWPVYSGRSFNNWNPDTGTYYAAADPGVVVEHLYEKRRRQAQNRRSAFFGQDEDLLSDTETLPCFGARIAFRVVSPSANPRTLIAALVPPRVVCNHMAPYLLRRAGDEVDEAYLLGVLSTVVMDWYVRRFVETSVDFHLFETLPLPALDRSAAGHRRIIEIAGRLAATDTRFAKWADSVGVDVSSVREDERDDLIARLDAAVAHAYGIDKSDIEHIFETFHDGWDYSERLQQVLANFDEFS